MKLNCIKGFEKALPFVAEKTPSWGDPKAEGFNEAISQAGACRVIVNVPVLAKIIANWHNKEKLSLLYDGVTILSGHIASNCEKFLEIRK